MVSRRVGARVEKSLKPVEFRRGLMHEPESSTRSSTPTRGIGLLGAAECTRHGVTANQCRPGARGQRA
jgi:hypothetical protein